MGGGASKKKENKAAEPVAEPATAAPSADAAPSTASSGNSESKTDETPAASGESKTNDEGEEKTEAKQNDQTESKENDEEEKTVPEKSNSMQRMQSLGDIFESSEKVYTTEEALKAGKNLGKLLQQKAEDGEVMQEHKALVFDCGTGETKAIFLKYYRTDDDQPVVEMKELNKAPATLDFLKRKQASLNEDYKKMRKLVETNKDKKGRVAFKTEEAREKARGKLNDGYWFLDKKPEGATDELLPQYFVEFCLQTKQKLEAAGDKPDNMMIGCSAWARDAGPLQREADRLVVELTKAGLLCKKLLQTQEGLFEAAAVGYAYNAMMSAGPDDECLPTGLIGSGGGSVQFMNKMLYPINMDCGNRMCLEAMEDAYDKSGDEAAGLASLEACFAKSDSFASKENVKATGLHGRVHGEIAEERSRTTEQFDSDETAKRCINSPLGGRIICISACYYGALSIGRANVKDQDMNEYQCKQIVEEMHAKIADDKKELIAGKHADAGVRGTLFKEIANLTLQTTLFEALFTDDAVLCFKRNWTLNGIPFRTTWTAGWYLNFLYGLNIKFPGANTILADYEATQQRAQELLKEAGARLGDVAPSANVAMVLVDMKSVIKGMRRLALQIANPIDKLLVDIANKYEGNLLGWPKYKIKGNGSLYRKLIGTIFDMLEKNSNVPEYTPNVEDCVASIHDSLRYTIVLPPDQYKSAVQEMESILLTGDNPRARSIKFKNFWREEDGETTYQGINAQVKLNPVIDLPTGETPVDDSPNQTETGGFEYKIPTPTGKEIPNSADFIFELQIHTPQSFAMKDGPGHLMYEDYRDPAIRKGVVKGVAYDGTEDRTQFNQFKLALYQTNKVLYRTKNPKDGTPLNEGDVVCEGLKGTKDHKWTDEDYTFKFFKPNPSMAFYKSEIESAEWVNKLQINKKLETKLTGLPYPHGYRDK